MIDKKRATGTWAIRASAGLVAWALVSHTADAQEINLAGMQLWNAEYWQTTSLGDYYGPNYGIRKLKPISLAGCRNACFSGYVVVTCAAVPITGLKATMSDLTEEGGKTIPASQVLVRYPELSRPETTWNYWHRFDRLLEAAPAEVPTVDVRPRGNWKPKTEGPVAMQPIWITVRVPRDAAPGLYEGKLTIESENNKVPPVPVKIQVSDWTLPDPKDFRMMNMAFPSPDALAKHYDVPLWSDKHFALMGKSMALMGEVNARQVPVNLAVDFYGMVGNDETMVRWIKQPDGTYKHDFTVFDKYLDLAAKIIGKPTLLRLNCWMEWDLRSAGAEGAKGDWSPPAQVTRFDPATGQTERMDQPPANTPEFLAFWRPVLEEVRKKIEARGWLDVTAMGHNSYCWGVRPVLVSAFHKIWPDGVWAYTAHNGQLGGHFKGEEPGVSALSRYSDQVWAGFLAKDPRGYRALLKTRPGFYFVTLRDQFKDWSEIMVLRVMPENEVSMGGDGMSDFGADLFPVRHATGRFYCVGNGRGTGGPNCSTRAMLAPGPDGPIATERFEAMREGVQISETILFIQRSLDAGKLPAEVVTRANAVLDERGKHLSESFPSVDKSGVRRLDTKIFAQNAQQRDAELYTVAGEVAKALK